MNRLAVFYRRHPNIAAAGLYGFVGATTLVGAVVGLGLAVEVESWMQRRAAS